jgi:Cysteine-rich secretory protein family/LysM domain
MLQCHPMNYRTLLCLTMLLLSLFPSLAYAQDDVGDLLGRINNLRANSGRAPYALNDALAAAAQDQAQWMVGAGTISHTRPDGSGPRNRALNAGYGTTDVSENIYGGTLATTNDAWNFWVNSDIHYRGLVNERYREIGIGIARGSWGNAYVLVFGNPGGPPPAPPASANNGGGGGNAPAAAPQQPSFVIGLDANGNIMHEVQPGDTLGDILLIYGYTWDTLPYIMQINGIGDVRDLDIGSVLLVPPQAGTYTPTPGNPESVATPTPTAQYPTPFPDEQFPTLSPVPAQPIGVATAAAIPAALQVSVQQPTSTATPQVVAQLPTLSAQSEPSTIITGGNAGIPTWIMLIIGLQVLLLIGATIEYIRRLRRK